MIDDHHCLAVVDHCVPLVWLNMVITRYDSQTLTIAIISHQLLDRQCTLPLLKISWWIILRWPILLELLLYIYLHWVPTWRWVIVMPLHLHSIASIYHLSNLIWSYLLLVQSYLIYPSICVCWQHPSNWMNPRGGSPQHAKRLVPLWTREASLSTNRLPRSFRVRRGNSRGGENMLVPLSYQLLKPIDYSYNYF